MTVTVLAPFRLAPGKTEQDLIAASSVFDRDFVSRQPGVLRRELLRKTDGSYIDVVQFRSQEDMEEVVGAEMASEVCHAFFAVMDISEGGGRHEVCASLATYAPV
ncbi:MULTISPECIES: hypothetical protein [Hyphobacterium]|uniref:ABM domain-containing protein n=1 Tax=Hyphobacterium vulgare TaxID=1736751 RepID=A0ABV6ZXX1_9PROT